jgi:hypothetical protein
MNTPTATAAAGARHALAAVEEEEDHGLALPGFPVEGRHRAGEEGDDGSERHRGAAEDHGRPRPR